MRSRKEKWVITILGAILFVSVQSLMFETSDLAVDIALFAVGLLIFMIVEQVTENSR